MTRQHIWLLILAAAVLASTGCEIVTEEIPEPPADFRPAGTVVINEVYTLPPTNPGYHSWIEFLNASNDTIDVTFWTLTMTTARLEIRTTLRLTQTDTTLDFQFIRSTTTVDGFGPYEVPIFAENLFLPPGQQLERVLMLPQDLRTFVNIENRLLATTRYGPTEAPGDIRADIQLFQGPVTRLDTISVIDSTTTLVNVYSYAYSFFIGTTDQLILKDETGAVKDVVRYGGYVWPGPGPDPYPGNGSIGLVPDNESICRYAGGYFTGNTRDDFYVTSSVVRPVPHWYSALVKRKAG